jgi:hypothetical protein
MQRHQLSGQAEQGWLGMRRDLDRLASAYNVAWNWTDPGYTQTGPARATAIASRERISSKPTRATILAAGGRTGGPCRAHGTEATHASEPPARLEAPELIAIERDTRSVTMASTRGHRVTFEADGRDHREQWSTDRTMTTRATSRVNAWWW